MPTYQGAARLPRALEFWCTESETAPCLEHLLHAPPQVPYLPPLDIQHCAQFSFSTGPSSLVQDTEPIQKAHWGHARRRHQATWGSHSFPSRKTLLLSVSLLRGFLCPAGQTVLCLLISPPALCCASLIIQQEPANRGSFWVSQASTMMALPEIIENEHMHGCLAPKADSRCQWLSCAPV